nr:DUF930 domain-containing protein [uncultured Cohaesibacter sp.]
MRPCEPNLTDAGYNRWSLRGFGTIASSLLMHGFLLLILLSIAPKLLPPIEKEDPISVEFVPPPAAPPAPPERTAAPAPAPQALAAKPQADPELAPENPSAPVKQQDGMMHSRQIFSQAVLTQKGNEEALVDYRNLAPDEQREQLCSLETLEQIAIWSKVYKPERMVSYTFGAVRYEGAHVIANGAVFWSHGNWHRVKFDCELSTDQSKVVNLAFAVGTIVPKSDWEDYYLTEYK